MDNKDQKSFGGLIRRGVWRGAVRLLLSGRAYLVVRARQALASDVNMRKSRPAPDVGRQGGETAQVYPVLD